MLVESLPKPLDLLRQTRVGPSRTRGITTLDDLALKLLVERLDKHLPAITRLATDQVIANPHALWVKVRLYLVTETNIGVATNLLRDALVQHSDSLLIVPVLWGWVLENDLAVVLGSKLHQKLELLVANGAIRQLLPTSLDKLVELGFFGEVCRVAEVGGSRAPLDVAKEIRLVRRIFLIGRSGKVIRIAVVDVGTSLGGFVNKVKISRVGRIDGTLLAGSWGNLDDDDIV